MEKDNPHRYDDIIRLPHPEPRTHPRMPLEKRAAIFSPYAALSGYGDEIKETARLTDNPGELSEEKKEELDHRLARLIDLIGKDSDGKELSSGIIEARGGRRLKVSITYFQPDKQKKGGAWITLSGQLRKVDLYQRIMIFSDGTIVQFDRISELLFSDAEAETQ